MRKAGLLTALFIALSWPPAVFGQYANDTFTDTDGVLLENHTPDVGTSWTKQSGPGTIEINANKIRRLAAGDAHFFIGVDSTNADYDIEALFDSTASGKVTPGILGRQSTTAKTAYGVRWGAGAWNMFKWINGTRTTIGSFTGSAPNTPKTGKLELRGSTQKFYLDGVLKITANDTEITAAGRAGVFSTSPDTLQTLDDWKATNPPAGGPPFPAGLINSPLIY